MEQIQWSRYNGADTLGADTLYIGEKYYTVCIKKGNPKLARCSTKTIQCMFNFFHILKDQSFSY